MTSLVLLLTLALVQTPAPAGPVAPVLAFPEPGVDDPAAYRGYQTRFYRDSRRNTVQIYLEPRAARTTLVWADAVNESAGFTSRDAGGRPAALTWDGTDAVVSDSAACRTSSSMDCASSCRASTADRCAMRASDSAARFAPPSNSFHVSTSEAAR